MPERCERPAQRLLTRPAGHAFGHEIEIRHIARAEVFQIIDASPRFLENLRTILNDSRLDARYLELELTQSSLISMPNAPPSRSRH